MVGGLGGGGKGKRYPPGHLQRPSSVGDFNEVDDDSQIIYAMPDHEVMDEFERMLDNMNLSEEKRAPLLQMPLSKKREMLSMSNKTTARSQCNSPADYIQYLQSPGFLNLSLKNKEDCIESLRVALTNNSLEWIQEFGTKGLKQVLSLLNECFRK